MEAPTNPPRGQPPLEDDGQRPWHPRPEIVPGKSDVDQAKEYHERMLGVLGPVLDIINEARQRHGMSIGFQISPPDSFNRQTLALLEISKKLC